MNVQGKKYTDSTQFATVYSLDFVPKTRLQTVLGSDLNRSSQKNGGHSAFNDDSMLIDLHLNFCYLR